MSAIRPPTPPTEALSLPEMLRIMDVATEMRRQRETVEKEFAIDETKQILREKLLQTNSITGERVTESEVDTAIDSYFNTLYTYREPAASVAVTLAHFYVRRIQLAISAALIIVVAGAGWWMLHSASRRFTQTVRTTRPSPPTESRPSESRTRESTVASSLDTSIQSLSEQIRAVAREDAVIEELNLWQKEIDVAREQSNSTTLKSISDRMTQLLNRLESDYEVRISSEPNQRSGFTRYFVENNVKHPAYYLIVSAKDDQGRLIRRTIRNTEKNQSFDVDQWAEQVPKEVYDRIGGDKKADGILNETLFAVKQRGHRDEEVRIHGADGKPLEKLGQITDWKD